MTDDRFEQRLRGFLTGREPAAVSPVLRARLQSVTAESPVHSGGWIRWLGGAWRAALGLAAAAVVAVVLLAVLFRTDALNVHDPEPVGAPSAVPRAVTVPFVTAPADLFTPGAVADAERRLAAVYAATRVEATLVVQAEAGPERVSTPVGWPDGFDRDGNGDRDITAVIGIAPDGTPVCCLTITGRLIDEAREDGYWRPLDQPGALDADLAADTAEFRDVALDRFVRGIEDLAPGIAIVEAEAVDRDDLARAVGLISVLGPLLLLAIVAMRRRVAAETPDRSDGVAEMLEVTNAVPTTPAVVTERTDTGPSLVRWTAPLSSAWPTLPDRVLVLTSFVAIAGLAFLGVVDLLLPAATDVRLDTSVDGIGAARAGLSLLPIALLGIGLAALIAYARQGRWRRRIGILGLVLAVGWTMAAVIDHTRPTLPGQDLTWVTGDPDAEVSRNAGGVGEYLTHRLAPGEAFTYATLVHNPGVLPVTILGLAGVRTTQPNPYVASIVSLGWVVQPTGTGPITTLSARPEDASASWPVTLRGGETLAIVIVGRAGPCAEANGTVTDLPLGHVDLRYRVLGFERTTEVGLPFVMSFPSKDPCTVEIPGGTVTYSTPE